MARLKILGGETGDLSEFPGAVAGLAIDGTTFNDASGKGGAYAVKVNSTSLVEILRNFTATSRARFKCYFRFDTDTTPGSQVSYQILAPVDSANNLFVCVLYLNQLTDGTFQWLLRNVSETADVITVAAAVVKNTWYRLELDVSIGAATGNATLYVDGVSVGSVSNTNFGTVNIGWLYGWANGNIAGRNLWIDDLEVDDAALCGESYVIARQFKAGTPTYDSWTKTAAQTIDQVWNATPFSAANNASSSSSLTSQTGQIANFYTTQAGHGSGVIHNYDTIKGLKAGLVANSSTGGGASIRVRLGGADTDTAITLTTSDVYYETAVFVDSVTNLAAGEVGVVHGANAFTQTVEDAWMMASYSPGTPPAANIEFLGGGPAVVRNTRMVAY